jgi:E3 ubiquitin-protein ligase DOA10
MPGGACKFCLCEENEETNPLINPCLCKGSCELVHVECLKQWIGNKVKKETGGIATLFNFTKLECEICKTGLPILVQLKSKVIIEMVQYDKPTKPYLLLREIVIVKGRLPRIW